MKNASILFFYSLFIAAYCFSEIEEEYDRIERVMFINEANKKISFEIDYSDNDYSSGVIKLDFLVNSTARSTAKARELKQILASDEVEAVFTLGESRRRVYVLTSEKCAEMIEVIDYFLKPL